MSFALKPRVAAVLGPTNTGKTHYAIERMLAHKTGVIGLPLRLLAREVYDRIVALRGPSVVALVTGEERIVPPRAAYWVATVEAMPQDIGADFVAIDEVQMCADPERGHVFTDRLLNLRGHHETLFLGANTMRGVIHNLVPGVEFMGRERFSELTYSGSKKISRMPARSAIVGFSVDQVYAIAELLRRQKGGAAVVMGALSPRTRNAQVEMYQNGEVDYLVATDAIGMGLNLDVDHVAFSGTSKFDGRRLRRLWPNEMAQIAGRAGRYKTDGTFGVTGEAGPLAEEEVAAIENHRFAPLKQVQWRNSRLEFGTVNALLNSLEHGSDDPILTRTRPAEDQRTLESLSGDAEIAARATDGTSVRLLWDVCRLPDFRQVSHAEHCAIAGKIYNALHENGRVGEDWLATQVAQVDKQGGGIDTLSKRLAFIRTWTYVAQRTGWVENETYWRDETRAVEDRLSDALHQALTQRFVDRRTSVLMRRLKQKESLLADVKTNGEVTVEDEFVGKLNGFRFQLDPNADAEQAKTLRSAALAALQQEFNLRADRMYNAADTEFDFTEQGGLMWGENAVGKLVKGDDILAPGIEAFVDDEAGADVAQKVERRLKHFMDRKIATGFEALIAMRDDAELTGLARGFAFRLSESLGVIPRSVVAKEVKELDQEARGQLRRHGVRFGQYTIFQHQMLKPAPTRLRLVLWSLQEGLDEFPEAPPPGLVTIPAVEGAPKGYYPRAGYRLSGERAIRIDMLERVADLTRTMDVKGGFEASADMLSISGLRHDQFANLMEGLGFTVESGEREKVKAVTEAEPNSGETEAKQAAGDPAPEVGETGTESAAEAAVPAEADVPVETTETAVAPEGEDGPEMETFYTFRWVPKQRPSQQGQRKPQEQQQSRRRKGGKKPPPKPAEFKAKPKGGKPKELDPDNPFAALAALKSK